VTVTRDGRFCSDSVQGRGHCGTLLEIGPEIREMSDSEIVASISRVLCASPLMRTASFAAGFGLVFAQPVELLYAWGQKNKSVLEELQENAADGRPRVY
jgi:hypothetical protein